MVVGDGDERRLSVRVLLLAWVVSFAIYGSYFQGQWAFGERPFFSITGDEPHYLTVATSIVRDRDLDIFNNYRDKEYFSFYPYHVGDSRDPEDMHALYGRDGRLYSKHSSGLPVLIAPAMAVGGHGLATVFLMMIAALLSVQILQLAWECSGQLSVTILAWVAIAFTPPLLFYASLFYPEMPGALLTIAGARGALQLWRRGLAGPRHGVLLVSAAIAFLPWLHLRYAPVAGVLALLSLTATVRGQNRGSLAALVLLPGLSAAALLGHYWQLFGGLPAVGEYGDVSISNVVAGAPGLFLDRAFGLLPYAPVYALVALGFWPMALRLGWLRSITLAAPFAVYAGLISTFSFWYGAFSPPARMLVPVLPLLVAPLAAALARWRVVRDTYVVLLVLTFGIAHLLVDVPRLRYNQPDGDSQMLVYLSQTWDRDLTQLFPSFVGPQR